MRRADGLTVLSRREVCTALAGCVGLALVSSCTDGDVGAVLTGKLNGSDGTDDHPDAAVTDAHMTDAGSMATCPTSGATDVGAPSTFTSGSPVYFSNGNFFVVRDSGGLYALTAKCTHEGATTCVGNSNNCSSSGTLLFCPRHGATFTFDGDIISGPVITGLVHYAMCTLANGHVAVITSQHVSNSQRLMA